MSAERKFRRARARRSRERERHLARLRDHVEEAAASGDLDAVGDSLDALIEAAYRSRPPVRKRVSTERRKGRDVIVTTFPGAYYGVVLPEHGPEREAR